MPHRLIPILLAAAALAGCQSTPDPRLGPGGAGQIRVAVDEAFRDRPFAAGPVRIVAASPDPVRALQTFLLVPCRGDTVCGGSEAGPAATVTELDGRLVVSGAYPGVRFHLGAAGAGFLERAGRFEPLAWE